MHWGADVGLLALFLHETRVTTNSHTFTMSMVASPERRPNKRGFSSADEYEKDTVSAKRPRTFRKRLSDVHEVLEKYGFASHMFMDIYGSARKELVAASREGQEDDGTIETLVALLSRAAPNMSCSRRPLSILIDEYCISAIDPTESDIDDDGSEVECNVGCDTVSACSTPIRYSHTNEKDTTFETPERTDTHCDQQSLFEHLNRTFDIY